jgi:adenylate cyclase
MVPSMPTEPTEEALGIESDPKAIRLQLDRILSSPEFQATKRNRAFLRFVVEETLAGRARFIKGYNIAQSVFNRDASFDPQLDPVVRIEASTLRRSLERYYLTEGREDSIRIDLPKGGYVPIFYRREIEGAAASPAPPPPSAEFVGQVAINEQKVPTVMVLPLKNTSRETGHDYLASGITEELISALTQFSMLRVIGVNTSFGVPAASEPSEVGQTHSLDYVVHGSIQVETEQIRITARLLRVADCAYVWSKSFAQPFSADSIISMETDIARTIGVTLGAPYGTIARLTEAQFRRAIPPNLVAYRSLLRWYQFRRSFSPLLRQEVRAGLEEAIKLAPHYCDIWAALAYMFVDEYRFGLLRDVDGLTALDQALVAARRAVTLDGESPLPRLALSIVHFYKHELDRASEEAVKALELNPYSPELMFQIGWRMAITGNWEPGMQLMRSGLDFDPDPPKWCRLIFALDAYRRHDGPFALDQISHGAIFQMPSAYVTGAAILAEFGTLDQAMAIVEKGADIYPFLFDDPGAQLSLHNVEPSIAQRLLASLSRCGVPALKSGGRNQQLAARRRPPVPPQAS